MATKDELGDVNDQCILMEKAEDIFHHLANKLKAMPQYGSMDTSKQHVVSLDDYKGGMYKTNKDFLASETNAGDAGNRNKAFLEISAADASKLVPSVKISIDFFNKKGKVVRSFPLSFPRGTNHSSNMFSSHGKREGAGIQSIEVIHEGIDTATEKTVLVNTSFLFQDLRLLTDSVGSTIIDGTIVSIPNYFSLIEMGLGRTGKKGDPPKIFRYIVFELGWSSSGPAMEMDKYHLERYNMSLKTDLVKYTFDLKEDGSIILHTQHRGVIHSVLGGASSNVLSMVKSKMEEFRGAGRQLIDDKVAATDAKLAAAQSDIYLKSIAMALLVDILRETKRKQRKEHTGQRTVYVQGSVMSQTTGEMVIDYTEAYINPVLSSVIINTAVAKAPLEDLTTVDIKAIKSLIRSQNAALITGFKSDSRHMAQYKIYDPTPQEYQTYFIEDIEKMVNREHSSAKVKANIGDVGVSREAANLIKLAKRTTAREFALMRFLGLREIGRLILKGLEGSSSRKLFIPALERTTVQDIHYNVGDTNLQKETFGNITMERFFVNNPGKINTSTSFNEADTIPFGLHYHSDPALAEKNFVENAVQAIPFIFFGDLLEVMLQLPADVSGTKKVVELMEETSGHPVKTVLGHMSWTSPFTATKVKAFPLYWFPLSLKKINDFFARDVVGKDKIFYSYLDFVKDLLNKILDGQFRVCERVGNLGLDSGKPKFDFGYGSAYHDFNTLEMSDVLEMVKAAKKTKGTKKGKIDFQARRGLLESLFFIYDSKNILNEMKKQGFGSYTANLARKIPHFYLGGPDRGISKTVKLQDIADPTLKAAIYFKDRGSAQTDLTIDGNLTSRGYAAPVVFEAKVDCLGYPFFALGQLIFIDGRSFITGKHANLFMATGYYGIKRITHRINLSSWSTEIYAILQLPYTSDVQQAISSIPSIASATPRSSTSSSTPSIDGDKKGLSTEQTTAGAANPGKVQPLTAKQEAAQRTEKQKAAAMAIIHKREKVAKDAAAAKYAASPEGIMMAEAKASLEEKWRAYANRVTQPGGDVKNNYEYAKSQGCGRITCETIGEWLYVAKHITKTK